MPLKRAERRRQKKYDEELIQHALSCASVSIRSAPSSVTMPFVALLIIIIDLISEPCCAMSNFNGPFFLLQTQPAMNSSQSLHFDIHKLDGLALNSLKLASEASEPSSGGVAGKFSPGLGCLVFVYCHSPPAYLSDIVTIQLMRP